uniref:polyhomeotic-like protein 2 n=1 Tax=Ciona intestinalis TaxID=7719 RepID=UPI000052497A|nr:polyhomeotic-like protein 2 [Ciona intestinalis]|eukprot:XP_026694223.1 polyhomeotic-like protein 2 [Ciona intestinalis]
MKMEDNDGDYILSDTYSASDDETQIGIKLSLEVLAKHKILTHIIDGFIIEESIQPFEPEVPSFLSSRQLNMIRERQQEIVAREKEREIAYEENLLTQTPAEVIETATCDQCGFMGPRSRFAQPSARFCSLGCARKYKTGCPKRLVNRLQVATLGGKRGRPRLHLSQINQNRKAGLGRGRKSSVNKIPPSPPHSISSSSSFSMCDGCSNTSESSFTSSPEQSPHPDLPEMSGASSCPVRWSVEDVFTFIKSLPDSSQHAEDFRMQEIDGSALLLLHEEHLVCSMNLPLGPALKLCAHIDRLREREVY